MRATVDQETCIGCELCPSISPDVFKMGEDGLAHTIVEKVPADAEISAREAAESCPVEAIKIDE